MLHYNPPFRYVCRACRPEVIKQSRRRGSTKSRTHKWLPTGPARTRFAPSPTGFLHLGSLRTALFNYLLAKRTGGQFLLRIEDTDAKRTVPGAEERILKDLRWAGLQWDEGPEIGGPHGPYRQSERTELYQSSANTLITQGHAYRCFCSSEQLKSRPEVQRFAHYDRTCFHIPQDQSEERVAKGESYVIRLKDPAVPPIFKDNVYGWIKGGEGLKRRDDGFEDPILIKSDGLPTYHLANVVDDHHMQITHVIRGAEWLISTRKHLTLYNCFGWKPPIYAHVGLLLDQVGNKLSKRDMTFDLAEMQRDGVLPEALNNFLALLGWTDRQSKSDFATMEQLKETFDLKLTKGNPNVALGKLDFLSFKHAALRVANGGAGFEEMIDHVVAAALRLGNTHGDNLHPILKEEPSVFRQYVSRALKSEKRIYTQATRFVSQQSYLFLEHPPFPIILPASETMRKHLGDLQKNNWSQDKSRSIILEQLKAIESWDRESLRFAITTAIENCVNDFTSSLPRGQTLDPVDPLMTAWVWQSLRGYVTWGMSGPGLPQTMELLGRETVLARVAGVEFTWESGETGEKSQEVISAPG